VADHIPFISSSAALGLAEEFYADSAYFRVPVEHLSKAKESEVRGRIWVDPGVDGLHDLESRRPNADRPASAWYSRISRCEGFEEVADPDFQDKPDASVVEDFVAALMEQCAREKPALITVPQLPIATDSSRNKINRALAKATGQWRSASRFQGKLILPLVFTAQEQTTKGRTPRVELAKRSFAESDASGFWAVDMTLDDESGSDTLRTTRLPGLLAMHDELAEAIDTELKIGGPYWGANLALWARRLIDYPAVGIGSGFQYFLPGGIAKKPSARVPLSPLRRRARSSIELRQWVDDALAAIPKTERAAVTLASLRKHFTIDPDRGRRLVAMFYKRWFDTLASHPPAGRSMALYQDLSAAYALGKTLLKDLPLPAVEKSAKRPEAVAAQLMMSCL
jgi:hypothetical protein